jgi:signal transduction histidine kinase
MRNLSGLMTNLINDLSDLSQIESGHMRLELGPTSLSAAVASATASVRKLIADQQQELLIDLPDDLPQVVADHGRLVQILSNLLSNAAKYTPPHGTIKLSALCSNDGLLQVMVQDSGRGINPDEQTQIFQPFFRTFEAHLSEQPGTGLGLSITRHIVELQGGQIWFTSAPNEGSTFCFTLPTTDVLAPQNKRAVAPRLTLGW